MLATSSVDKTVTIWDTFNCSTEKKSFQSPIAKLNKNMKVGKLFTLNFYPSSPWLLGCGGSSKEIALWDMTQDDIIQKCFGGRSKEYIPTQETIAIDKTREKEKEKAFDMIKSDSNAAKLTTETESKKISSSKKKKKKTKKAHRAGR